MLLLNKLLVILTLADTLENITIVRVLHHNTDHIDKKISKMGDYLPKRAGRLVKESLTIRCNKWVLDRRQDANFVECIGFLPVRQVLNLDFLQGVDLLVSQALHLVDARV